MTRTITAIMMVLWFLCQQVVADVIAYDNRPSPLMMDDKHQTTHCQESSDSNAMFPTDATHSNCDGDCRCCAGGCTNYLLLTGHVLYFKTVMHSPTLDIAIADPISSIHSLFRPPIAS